MSLLRKVLSVGKDRPRYGSKRDSAQSISPHPATGPDPSAMSLLRKALSIGKGKKNRSKRDSQSISTRLPHPANGVEQGLHVNPQSEDSTPVTDHMLSTGTESDPSTSLPTPTIQQAAVTPKQPVYILIEPPTSQETGTEYFERHIQGIKSRIEERNSGSVLITSSSLNDTITHTARNLGNKYTRDDSVLPLDCVKPLHTAFSRMFLEEIPGLGDCTPICIELSPRYEGRLPGTVSTEGKALEHNEYLRLAHPRTTTYAIKNETLPSPTVADILARIRLLRSDGIKGSTPQQQAEILANFVGRRSNEAYAWTDQVTDLHNALTIPVNFEDFINSSSVALCAFGPSHLYIGLSDVLHEILLGYELLVRLEHATDRLSKKSKAIVIIAKRWVQNVAMELEDEALKFNSLIRESQLEGLVRFAEIMDWPFQWEPNGYVPDMYPGIFTEQNLDLSLLDCWDYLHGTYIGGSWAARKIMAMLVHCTPKLRHLGAAHFFYSCLVLEGVTYWRSKTVLARVFGGYKGVKAASGWVGPCPAVVFEGGDKIGNTWVRVIARSISFNPSPPKEGNEDSVDEGGLFSAPRGGETPQETITALSDMSRWRAPVPPSTSADVSVLKAVKLKKLRSKPGEGLQVQASLEFSINRESVRFTCLTMPVFVTAHPCFGTHVVHDRRSARFVKNIVEVRGLMSFYTTNKGVLIINATGEGGELVARAWCAERGRHAVVRRGSGTCFVCAMNIARDIGIDVLIWS